MMALRVAVPNTKNGLMQMWTRYNVLLKERPIATKATTAGVILGLADYTCQRLEGKESVDVRRVLAMSATGALLVGPLVHKWYSFLGRVVGEKTSVRVVGTKIALDQAFFLPVMFGTIMTSANMLNGKSWEENKAKLEAEYFGAVKRGWSIWSVATTCNFALIPPHLRVLFNNTVSYGWNTYLSKVNNAPLPSSAAVASANQATTQLASAASVALA